ncbi:MAG: hypothetical protein ACR2RF_25485 [Geminicoccaceae bacterium]
MTWFDVSFGPTSTALGTTVGYELFTATGGVILARTNAGVFEIGNGAYGVNIDPPATAVVVEWSTATTGTIIYAHEDLSHVIAQRCLVNGQVTDQTPGELHVLNDLATTVWIRAAIHEDSAGTIIYRGKGIERRGHLAS